MCTMIEDVRDKCKEKGVKILCEVSDGKWIQNINHDTNGNPLAKLQFQKKMWNESISMNKKDMIQYLLNISSVYYQILRRWSKKIKY